MSNAIEVLKRIKQDNYLTGVQLPAFSQDEANKKRIKSMRERDNALDEAIVALEQKEKLKVWLERNIKKDVEMGSFTDWWTDGHINALKEVLELMK